MDLTLPGNATMTDAISAAKTLEGRMQEFYQEPATKSNSYQM